MQQFATLTPKEARRLRTKLLGVKRSFSLSQFTPTGWREGGNAMRNTTISSSIASVVCRVIASVAVAGIAVRTFLHLTFMREHLGYWRELGQPGSDFGGNQQGYFHPSNPMSGSKPGLLRHFGISAPAYCPSPSRLASVRANRQG